MITIITLAIATAWLVGFVAILPRAIREIRAANAALNRQ